MKNTFLFECKKILKKKTTWAAFILSVVAIISFYFFNVSVADDIHQGNITRIDNNILAYEGFIGDFETEMQKAEAAGNSEVVEEMEANAEYYSERIKDSEKLKEVYINEDWNTIIQNDLDSLKVHVDFIDSGSYSSSYSIEEQEISPFTLRASFEEKQLLNKNNIDPYIQNTVNNAFLSTIYDEFTGSALEQWESLTKRYGTNALSFLYQIIQLLYIPIVVLIGCFIFGNNISSEKGKKKRGLHFYATLPFQKGKLFISKYLSGLLYTFGFTFIMILVPFLCGLFTKGLGSLKFPVLIYEGSEPNSYGSEYNTLNPIDDQFHFIEMQEYLWQVLVFSIILVIFLYSIYYFLSLFIQNPGITTILLGVLTYTGMNIMPSPFNPFTYVDVHKVVTREIATLTFNPSIQLQTGLTVLLVVGVLMIILSFLRFKFGRA